jgi:nucleoside-diphosphate-sugar epimerase
MVVVVAADRDRCWGRDMKILIFGGTGFVGLNLTVALLASGHAVTLFDRANLPAAAQHDFAGYREALTVVQGDVTDRQPVSRLEQEFGWRARFGCAESAVDLGNWWMQHQEGL